MAARARLTRINPEGLKALRQLALDRDTTVQALMIEAPAGGGRRLDDPEEGWRCSSGFDGAVRTALASLLIEGEADSNVALR